MLLALIKLGESISTANSTFFSFNIDMMFTTFELKPAACKDSIMEGLLGTLFNNLAVINLGTERRRNDSEQFPIVIQRKGVAIAISIGYFENGRFIQVNNKSVVRQRSAISKDERFPSTVRC